MNESEWELIVLCFSEGKMIIFTGGHASGFRNVHDYDTYDLDGTRLFHVPIHIIS